TSVLSKLAGILRGSRPALIVELDDGWHADRDLSVAVGHWGWLDLRLLVEEHARGQCLVRFGTRLRFSSAGVIQAAALAGLLALGSAAMTAGWPSIARVVLTIVAATIVRAAWQTSRTLAVVSRTLSRLATESS